MLLSPADPSSAESAVPGEHTGSEAWLAAPLAEMPVEITRPSGRMAQAVRHAEGIRAVVAEPVLERLGSVSVPAGGCFVRQLPLDGTCASVARRLFKEAVAGTGLPVDLVHDGVTMASELAANTLNAHGNIEYAGPEHQPVSGVPEFWLYLRDVGPGREVVCKIFDSEPGWDAGEPVPVGAAVPAGPESVRGRGLQLVAGLSAGSWGHHPTRARLGAWKLPGKAVWFALRVPPGSELAHSARIAPRGVRALEEVALGLAERGLGNGLVLRTEPRGELAVLSVRVGLTVWCRGEVVWWQNRQDSYDRVGVTDLTEGIERIVCAHEELLQGSQRAESGAWA